MAGVVNSLPYPAALAVGAVNAWMMFHIFRFRVRDARRRIRQVFGDRFSRREVNRIAWESWRNIVFNGIEMMRTARFDARWIETHVDGGGYAETMKKHLATGKGAILAVPHMGSWELGPVISRLQGIPLFSIEARQKNPLVNAYIDELRAATGIDLLERGTHTMREVLRRLKAGQVLAILPDVRMPTPGVRVPFLGGEANIGKGLALFAIHTQVPVFPAMMRRVNWTRHTIAFLDPIWPDPNLPEDEDVLRMTAAVLRIVDEAIRQDPGQWFWFNKRWILDPVNLPNAAGPTPAADGQGFPGAGSAGFSGDGDAAGRG